MSLMHINKNKKYNSSYKKREISFIVQIIYKKQSLGMHPKIMFNINLINNLIQYI